MPNFEVLDARIASALNKIIHNSQFKRRISLEEQKAQKQDRFFRGRQIAYMIYDQFRVTGTHDSVENYTDLFTISLRNDDIQVFDSKWDGIPLSMTQIPSDDILEGLYKSRIRESEKLKTVLELYDLETHQKKLRPDYHRLKAMVKRSIEQEIRNKNFGARSGNFEKNLKQRPRVRTENPVKFRRIGMAARIQKKILWMIEFLNTDSHASSSREPSLEPASSRSVDQELCAEDALAEPYLVL